MVKNELLEELGLIMKEEYHIDFDHNKLVNFANFLMNFFEILIKTTESEDSYHGK